jgi:hypothetical protein
MSEGILFVIPLTRRQWEESNEVVRRVVILFPRPGSLLDRLVGARFFGESGQ